jgi:predicted ATPase
MRVRSVVISAWRNLREVDLEVDPAAPLVCLVGENGAGKSAVLELLSAAAHHLGIAQGVEMARGNPFDEVHDVQVVVQVPTTDLDLPEDLSNQLAAREEKWDGSLRLVSRRGVQGQHGPVVSADGIAEPFAQQIGQTVVNILRQRKETQHLYLDADRAYPPTQIEPHRYAEIWQQEWEDPEFTRQWAYRPTRTLYEEWMKYFLGVEERCATQHITAIRRARDATQCEPAFVDPFDGYRATLHEVLPHLRFVGVESGGQRRTPLFDSAGLELPFHRLSGGEREIAFLIGQIERFRLRRGLLFIDEPELHLNPDLLRNWLAFLRDTVSEGQVWIATHSLEAVEVAGPSSTFVFERDPQSRTVTAPRRLEGRPVLSALAAAVGSPAFAISRLRFVYIEGDRQSRERERFYAVCGGSNDNRFLEGGSCSEVLRRLRDVRSLALETDEQLHIGGVIDRDFRTDTECIELEAQAPVHVLGCHEVENLYLQPHAVAVLLGRANRDQAEASTLVQNCADAFAGLWIAQHASAAFSQVHAVPKDALSALRDASWSTLQANWISLRQSSVDAVEVSLRPTWEALLETARARFQSDRLADDWFRRCLGKQTLGKLAVSLGFKSAEPLERNVVALWNGGEVSTPVDLIELRNYVDSLSA